MEIAVFISANIPNPVPIDRAFSLSSSGIFKKSQLFDENRCHTYIVQMNKECLTHNSDTYKIHIARMKGKFRNRIIYYFFPTLLECCTLRTMLSDHFLIDAPLLFVIL